MQSLSKTVSKYCGPKFENLHEFLKRFTDCLKNKPNLPLKDQILASIETEQEMDPDVKDLNKNFKNLSLNSDDNVQIDNIKVPVKTKQIGKLKLASQININIKTNKNLRSKNK